MKKSKPLLPFAELYTPEGEHISDTPWQDYPRPQLKRDSFFCLNGLWELMVTPEKEIPTLFDRKILVPFAPETLLSGVHELFCEDDYLYYKKTFTLPEGFLNDRLILHFDAVDQYADVYLNGSFVGSHVGGYEAFSFDVTPFLQEENTLIVRASDHLSRHDLPYGKQRRDRGGMWYTPTTGIWQSVWLESVPENYIEKLRIDTDGDKVTVTVTGSALSGSISVALPEGELTAPLTDGKAQFTVPSPRCWSPEDPYLYFFTVTAGEDTVESYFALRTLSVETVDGIPRLCLNGKPYFFHGLLDQGYWSDGLLTPADPVCFEKDILAMKELGFNMLRKHIKIEPELFYYHCDRLGMVVFQDMVNNGPYSFFWETALPTVGIRKKSDKYTHADPTNRRNFITAMEQTVNALYNHPCICYWTIFNEGWGQFESSKMYRKLKELDPTRFIDSASGWYSGGESDVVSEHIYFKPCKFKFPYKKPLVLSEFGGYALPVKEHFFNPNNEYGYKHFDDMASFENALVSLYEREIVPAVEKGLCGAIYTQVSDVEDETNGLLTFDRKVRKATPERMLPIAEKLCIRTK